MSGNRLREVYVDDSDPLIHYTGDGWFEDAGSLGEGAMWGPSFLRTLHGTKKNDSLSFSFYGLLLLLFSCDLSCNSTLWQEVLSQCTAPM